MLRNISTDTLLNPPDDVIEEAFDADLEIRCALEYTDNPERRAMLITCHLMTDPDVCVKLAPKLFVKDDILKRG